MRCTTRQRSNRDAAQIRSPLALQLSLDVSAECTICSILEELFDRPTGPHERDQPLARPILSGTSPSFLPFPSFQLFFWLTSLAILNVNRHARDA